MGGVGQQPQTQVCIPARVISPCRRDQVSPVIEMTLFLEGVIIIRGVPDRASSRQLQPGDVIILKLSRGRESIIKIAHNPPSCNGMTKEWTSSVGSAITMAWVDIVRFRVKDLGTS